MGPEGVWSILTSTFVGESSAPFSWWERELIQIPLKAQWCKTQFSGSWVVDFFLKQPSDWASDWVHLPPITCGGSTGMPHRFRSATEIPSLQAGLPLELKTTRVRFWKLLIEAHRTSESLVPSIQEEPWGFPSSSSSLHSWLVPAP